MPRRKSWKIFFKKPAFGIFESVAGLWETFHKGVLKLETVEGTGIIVEKSVESVNTKSIQADFSTEKQSKTGENEKNADNTSRLFHQSFNIC